MADQETPNPIDPFAGVPPEFVVIAIEKVGQRFQFCDMEDPVVQSVHQISVLREAQNLMKGETLPW